MACQVPTSSVLGREQSHRTCICDKLRLPLQKFSKLSECAMALLMVLVLTMQVAVVLPALLLNRHGCCILSTTAAGSQPG